MIVGKKWHTLCESSLTSFDSVGGCNSFGPLANCEKYDIVKNTWTLIPMMNEAKFYCGAASLSQRYLFVFAGYNNEIDLSTIEKLDEYDLELGWSRVRTSNELIIWSARRNIGCYPISNNEIIIFGGWDGNWRNETFIFNSESETLLYAGGLKRGEKFYRSKPKKIENNMYIIGYHFSDLHMYNIIKRAWAMNPKEKWAPKL